MEEVLERPVGRLAPSPTGALHLGNVRTFMIAWLSARARGGKVIMRMEDLDHPKDKPGAAVQAIEDLKWLGFDWDEEYVQSERKAIYRSALEYLHSHGFVYPCVCSRRDVEAAQSAPHAGEQLFYPGTCRNRFASYAAAQAYLNPSPLPPANPNAQTPKHPNTRNPCWRFRVPEGTVVSFKDEFAGDFAMDVSATLGDFPVARDEGGAGYTLAVVVDDVLMGVTEVVRGDDLLAATPAQILLARALAHWFLTQTPNKSAVALAKADNPITQTPSYCHVPLVVGPDGKRLAKRHGDTRVASYREQGKCPEEILGFLAASCGWCAPGERVSLADLVSRFSFETLPHTPFVV